MASLGGMVGRGGNRIDLTSRLEEWRRLLLDTSKRSRLVSSKFGRGGILAVEHPDFYQLWEQLAVNGQPINFPWPSKWTEADQVDESATEGDVERQSPKGVLSATQIESINHSLSLSVVGLDRGKQITDRDWRPDDLPYIET